MCFRCGSWFGYLINSAVTEFGRRAAAREPNSPDIELGDKSAERAAQVRLSFSRAPSARRDWPAMTVTSASVQQ
jgi:hypothetical protein